MQNTHTSTIQRITETWIGLLGLFPLHISETSSFHRLAFKLKRLQERAAYPSPQLHAVLQEADRDCH